MSKQTATDPWPVLRSLRNQGPVLWHDALQRWILTTQNEARSVLTDYRRFTVEGTSMSELFGADAFISIDDRSRHDPLRAVWADSFRRERLEALRPVIATMVGALLSPSTERLRNGEHVDIEAALCRPLPTLVIAHMMGVTEDMLPEVVRWSDAMAAGGPAYLVAAEALQRREAAKTSLADYLQAQVSLRRRHPGEDLISAMVHAEAARALTDAAIVENARQLLFAGNETTAKWLAHIFLTLGLRPDVRRALHADRSLVPLANDEVMRWQGVVGTVVRRVRGGPVELAGAHLDEGALLTCVLTSANRDATAFDDPERFDIRRPSRPNLGFGVGLHHCLGINLAKLEAEIAVNALLDAVPDFSIAEPFGYTTLPLRGPRPVTIALDSRAKSLSEPPCPDVTSSVG